MSNKSRKIAYWVTTGLLTVIVLMFVGNSVFNHELFNKRFAVLGYPTYLIYPLVIAKLTGLAVLWSNKSTMLKEWAYAGFCFVFILAIIAEMHADEGELFSSPAALVLLFISYIISRNIFSSSKIISKL